MNNLFKQPQLIEQARHLMIEQQIRPWNVFQAQILQLLAQHKREEYLPRAQLELAFVDSTIDLGAGHFLLEPKLEARIIQDAAISAAENVLLVGANAYMAALLSSLAKTVVVAEVNPDFAQQAQQRLADHSISNIEVIVADAASAEQIKGAPFDLVLLAGSIAKIPPQLWQQLRIGGRIVGIIGSDPVMRMTIATKLSATEFGWQQPWDANAPRLVNFPETPNFVF